MTVEALIREMDEYLTTREVAELLRIRERKVYDLASSGRLPCSKSMGKLLFPRAAVEAWVAAGTATAAQVPHGVSAEPLATHTGTHGQGAKTAPPSVMLGSHDPLLDWALRESRSGLASYADGSLDGLTRLAAGEGVAAGLHLYDAERSAWNTPQQLGACAQMPGVLVEWARRRRGLVLAPDVEDQIGDLGALAGRRFAGRQPEAGASLLFEALCREVDLDPQTLETVVVARSETDAALAVAAGKAEAAFGLETVAQHYRLAFLPLLEERFDLLVDRRAWFEPPMQRLMAFAGGSAFQERAAEMPGYDISGLGTVHFNGP